MQSRRDRRGKHNRLNSVKSVWKCHKMTFGINLLSGTICTNRYALQILLYYFVAIRSQCSPVGIQTRPRTGWPRNRGFIPDWSNIILFPQKRSDFATYPVSYVIVTGKRALFVGINSRRVKLTVHLHLVPRINMHGVICSSLIHLRGAVLN